MVTMVEIEFWMRALDKNAIIGHHELCFMMEIKVGMCALYLGRNTKNTITCVVEA